MVCVDMLRVALGRLGQHPLGTEPTDHAADVAPQLECGLEPTVGIPEERHIIDADDVRRDTLLLFAKVGHRKARHRTVGAASFAARTDAIRDIDASIGPAGDRTGGAEIDIVRVGGDDEDAIDVLVRVAHSHAPRSCRLDPVARTESMAGGRAAYPRESPGFGPSVCGFDCVTRWKKGAAGQASWPGYPSIRVPGIFPGADRHRCPHAQQMQSTEPRSTLRPEPNLRATAFPERAARVRRHRA